jgi:glucose-6-phosphate 1-dehydrogenase
VPPDLYEVILNNLTDSKLALPCDDLSGWTRVLIEKPFGNDIKTAHSLDKLLGRLFKEEQIFRIDHYLAKEALQNIVAFRFSNPIWKPMWSNKFIDKVHIKLFETIGVSGRGKFYDPIGALKDMGQSHMLQMLALIAMEEPGSTSASDIRRERLKVLKSLKKIAKGELAQNVVKGQYEGYLKEEGVSTHSKTETYFRVKAALNLPRWRGVPFYLENGKSLAEAKTEIDIYFKSQTGRRPKNSPPEEQNILTFRIQPDEGIKIKFFVKTPGYGFTTEAKTLKFKYSDIPAFSNKPNDYEKLIHDAFQGDQTLFASTPEILASWEFVTSILENWGDLPLKVYEKGAREIE